MDDRKPWKCPNGHVMGYIERDDSHQIRVRYLDMLRNATASELNGIYGFAKVYGGVYDITCSICGAKRSWFPGDEYIEKLIEKSRR